VYFLLVVVSLVVRTCAVSNDLL